MRKRGASEIRRNTIPWANIRPPKDVKADIN